MKVFFYSIDDDNNKIHFNADGFYEEDFLTFEDKSIPNTKIYLKQENNELIFKRLGFVEMNMRLKHQEKTKAKYKNDMGVEFDFETITKILSYKDNRIDIEYDMILDDKVYSTHKIWIIIR